MTPPEIASTILAIATLLSSLASLVAAIRTGQKTSATHDLVNGQSTRLTALSEAKGLAEGKLEGQPGVVGKSPTGEWGVTPDRPPSG